MESDDILEGFMKSLWTYFTGCNPESFNDVKIFRPHNNRLEESGDLSFPLNRSGWLKHTSKSPNVSVKIIDFVDKYEKNELQESDFSELFTESLTWDINISSCQIQRNKVIIFLHRAYTFKKVLSKILADRERFGENKSKLTPICIKVENEDNISDLSGLRLRLLKDVTVNLLKSSGCHVLEDSESGCESICLTNKSVLKCPVKKIVCGVVISNKYGKKNTNISAEEFYRKRTVDMQLMAQHKYGVRVTSEPGWSDFFKRLGSAAVTIDLLYVKINRPVIVNEDCFASTCSKGAPFILYNCARIAEILKRFEYKIASKEIPELMRICDIDFGLLNQPEEWELLYVYLTQYPSIVKSCVGDILECRLNVHYLCIFLESLCSTFSVYYRRVRILTEPRPHLLPVMYARIYLIMGIQHVLHNALALLNIPPIKQM